MTKQNCHLDFLFIVSPKLAELQVTMLLESEERVASAFTGLVLCKHVYGEDLGWFFDPDKWILSKREKFLKNGNNRR